MKKGITLVSINVEHGKHSDTVFDFLARTQPDVACIQEIRQADIADFRTALKGADFFFDPMTSVPKRAEPAILTA